MASAACIAARRNVALNAGAWCHATAQIAPALPPVTKFLPFALCCSDSALASRVAELETALRAAEHDVGEAEAMAQEAMEMAEAAQVCEAGVGWHDRAGNTWAAMA